MHSDETGIIDLYRRHAATWASRRDRRLTDHKWLDRFLALLPEGTSVLDIGCGSGAPIARYLIEKGCAVTGIDTSPELIAIASENLPGATWTVADMRGLDLNRQFDGIFAWNSSFHLTPDDQRLLFPMFQRHAAPGAALMFTSGPSHGEAIGEFEGERLYHGSLAPDEYQALLERHGFDVVDHVVEDPDCGGQTVWLARLRDTS